ncbi:Methyltransferase-like protein 24 [Amphibalanus amphitrite]|uniref:Methyltransferase-like protein 24 n=1 Tax=Amphibalanus amphitrite TaxID=1232801 RepID=A0A6A4WG87_AMPAM|nr:Methyltransferase-like protein 24 [Amphibalanus amphitrite]
MKALYNYLEHPQQCCRDLRPFGGTPGHSDGSKMVCMDAEVAPPSGSCLAYSFGVANDWSFDRAMYEHGCEVHSFDPSVNHTEGRTPFGPIFRRQGLSGDENTTREDGWIVMTLGDTMDSLGHGDRTLHYLKVDVEGAEWTWLDVEHEEVLSCVRQLAMEVHFLELQLFETEEDLFEVLDAYITSFELLRSLGFCLVSVSENPINPGRRVMPRWGEEKATLFEVLWVKR